jgi:hypothetical protein
VHGGIKVYRRSAAAARNYVDPDRDRGEWTDPALGRVTIGEYSRER